MRPKLIAKFGGTSLADSRSWEAALSILQQRKRLNPLVVVSAVGSVGDRPKVTDTLQTLAEAALSGGPADCSELIELHRRLLCDLGLDSELLDPAFEHLNGELQQLGSQRSPREQALDRVMGWGERSSATIMAACLEREGWKSRAADPAEIHLVTDDRFQDATVLESSLEPLAKIIISSRDHLVVPGYVGVTADGRPTTLGRGGSDYTAAILGAALKRDVEIWTDVDGVAITNPAVFAPIMRDLGHPRTIPRLSHEEAYQMAAFGSRVLYQKCLGAANMAARKGRHLRLVVKNTFNPAHAGTVVESHGSPDGRPKGITALTRVQLLTVYLDREEDYRELLDRVRQVAASHLLMASYSTGRASFVFDRLVDEVEALETTFPAAHLSRDQVLIKVVGDGIGGNHEVLGAIHRSVDSLEDPERFGVPLLHKSPQLLTDSTFEAVALKRGAHDVILRLYKDLFCQHELHLGMLGLGTVAGGVLEYARELYSREKTGYDLSFPIALVRDTDRLRPFFEGRLTDDADEVLDDPRVDVVVELMGGLEPARSLVLRALARGKHVITANKALLAEHGQELFEAARRHKRNIGFEASVCGEIPVLEVVQDMPSSQDVEAFYGIFNGTSNYLLTRMGEGLGYAEALEMAQRLGFAEADPTLDVSGADATQKLSILASLVFHCRVDWKAIDCQGVQSIRAVDTAQAAHLGFALRPVSYARRRPEGLELWTGPALVSRHHSLFPVAGETNAVSLEVQGRSEPFTLVGKGAGALPTARSVVRDIIEVARRSRHRMVALPGFHAARPIPVLPPGRHRYPWWIRFTVTDEPGVFGTVARVLGEEGLSIRQASQHDSTTEDGLAHIMLTVKRASREVLQNAMASIARMSFLQTSLAVPVLEE